MESSSQQGRERERERDSEPQRVSSEETCSLKEVLPNNKIPNFRLFTALPSALTTGIVFYCVLLDSAVFSFDLRWFGKWVLGDHMSSWLILSNWVWGECGHLGMDFLGLYFLISIMGFVHFCAFFLGDNFGLNF